MPYTRTIKLFNFLEKLWKKYAWCCARVCCRLSPTPWTKNHIFCWRKSSVFRAALKVFDGIKEACLMLRGSVLQTVASLYAKEHRPFVPVSTLINSLFWHCCKLSQYHSVPQCSVSDTSGSLGNGRWQTPYGVPLKTRRYRLHVTGTVCVTSLL